MSLRFSGMVVALVVLTGLFNNVKAEDPAEILQRRVGTWITETTSRKAEWTPEETTTTGEETIRWILDKKVQITEGWSKPDDHESTGLIVYDQQTRQYRSWWFNNKGMIPRGETTGQWDAPSASLHFRTNLGNGNTQTLKLTFTNPDRFDWTMMIRNQDGRTMMDVVGHTTRKTVASATFDGDGPPSDTTQKFDMGVPHYIGVVDSVAPDGSVRIAPPGGSADGLARRPTTEGYYLGIVAVGTNVDKLFRVQVAEILTDNAIVVQVDADAAKNLTAGEQLALFRPAAATTAQLRAVPGYTPIVAVPSKSITPAASESTPLAASMMKLKKIGLALHNFHDTHRRFPPAAIYGPDGKPWHSWRVLLLPFLQETKLYARYRFDEPWDGPNNSKLLDSMPDVYRDPVYGDRTNAYTNYAVVLGENTAFRARGGQFDGNTQGLAKAYEAGRSFQEFVDGVSNTLLLGPVSPDQKIPWLKPADLSIDALSDEGMQAGFSAPHRTVEGMAGAFLMADGRPEAILGSVDRTKLRQLFTINDGQVVGNIFAMPVVPPPKPVPRLHIVQTKNGPVAKIVSELVAPDTRHVDESVPIQGPAPEGSETSTINGTWIVESHVEDGQEKVRSVGDRFVFIAEMLSIKGKDGGPLRPVYRYKLDRKATPRTIEMTSIQRPTTIQGIYKLEGDKLTMCIADSPDDERPTEFKATTDWALIILKRDGAGR